MYVINLHLDVLGEDSFGCKQFPEKLTLVFLNVLE
jgi:hypothetical protein